MTDADLYTYAGLAIRTLLTVMVLTWLIEMLAFRRLRPLLRASLTVTLAWLASAATTGPWRDWGQRYDPYALILYLPAAAIVWFFYLRSLTKAYGDGPDE
jgi:hypothetical protein